MAEEKCTEPNNLIIEQIEIGPMQNFTYLIGCRSTQKVVVVDPAWDVASEGRPCTATLPCQYTLGEND